MKRAVLAGLFAVLFTVTACNTVGESSLEVNSRWELVESKVSIGGPAQFTPTDQVEFVEILSSNEIRNTNGWCGEGEPTTAPYASGVININCNMNSVLNFSIDDDIMIISNPACIEGCEYKYRRVKS